MEEDGKVDKKQIRALKAAELSIEEKLNYCLEWEKSGLSKARFCRLKNISVVSFKYWYYRFYFGRDKIKEAEPLSQWSPVVAKHQEGDSLNQKLQLELVLSDKMLLRISLLSSDVVRFIQELSHAITVVR